MNVIELSSPLLGTRTYSQVEGEILRNGERIKAELLTAADQLQLVEAHFAFSPELTSVSIAGVTYDRVQFFQNPQLWHHLGKYEITPEKWIKTKGEPHPERPTVPDTQLYSRFSPQIGKTISIRKITPEDIDTFHRWHNLHRVSYFWELNKSREELLTYIQDSRKNPVSAPVILEVNGAPVGYFEIYWVKEDRLGAYYDTECFDRGFHFLIGDNSYLGSANTDAFVKSVLHYMYLDEARTRRVMVEPRADNAKVLRFADPQIGWTKLKEFNFPHKRSALLENRREIFFEGAKL